MSDLWDETDEAGMSIKTETTDDRNRFGELMTAADDLVLFRAAVEKEFHRLHGSPERKHPAKTAGSCA